MPWEDITAWHYHGGGDGTPSAPRRGKAPQLGGYELLLESLLPGIEMTPDVLRYAMLNLQRDPLGTLEITGTSSSHPGSRVLAGKIDDMISDLEELKQESSDAVMEWAKLVVDHGYQLEKHLTALESWGRWANACGVLELPRPAQPGNDESNARDKHAPAPESREGGSKRRKTPPCKQHLYSEALLGITRRYQMTLATMEETRLRALKRLGEMPAGLSDLKASGTLVQTDSGHLLSGYKGSLATVRRAKRKQEDASKKPTWFLFSIFSWGRWAEQDDGADAESPSLFRGRGDQGIPRDWEAEMEMMAAAIGYVERATTFLRLGNEALAIDSMEAPEIVEKFKEGLDVIRRELGHMENVIQQLEETVAVGAQYDMDKQLERIYRAVLDNVKRTYDLFKPT
ncbi:hypothetical protein QBC39DRAFT_361615 [Podospora conica]|nr:hypothetical protein QBC39DRAFT_361615 [Schizothecium conicum]